MKRKYVRHGLRKTPEYSAWDHAKQRCHNPKDKWYKDYGARGIYMCERWLNSVETFFSDMGSKPSPIHSLERRDNSGGYSPDNCYWALPAEQNRNKRDNRFLEWEGNKYTYAELARKYNINRGTLRHRVIVAGWDLERALTQPLKS